MIIVAIALGLGIFFLSKDLGSSETMKRLYDLEDVSPENQGGNFNTDYDLVFNHEAELTKVPFALLKAHAIQESSINPRAFKNENPSGRTDRIGWASRGLMQVLWWPGSQRWARFGYPDQVLNQGESLYKPEINIAIAARLIAENLKACNGNIRDTINMYNTGVKESKRVAPFSYVDKVMRNYNIILGKV